MGWDSKEVCVAVVDHFKCCKLVTNGTEFDTRACDGGDKLILFQNAVADILSHF